MKKIIITGASGFIGTTLSTYFLNSGYRVTGMGTSEKHPVLKTDDTFSWVSSDTSQPGVWQSRIEQADIIINLAGRNIFNFWTKKYKQAIYDSRVKTTRNIVDAMAHGAGQVFLSGSAVGIYGDCGDVELTESTSSGEGFLADVCKDWETEAQKAGQKGVRVSVMRFGVVLGDGVALSKMLPAFRMFAGGPLGNGLHWFPWIHIEDLVNAVVHLIDSDEQSGVFNFTAPVPVRQKHFAQALGKCLNRPSFMPAPAFVLRILMGELGGTLLQSQKAFPQRLQTAGFSFAFPVVASALNDILKS